MLGKFNDRYREELRDEQLSAMLREALADDPALSASAGRTNHIMRKILASGVMPIRRRLPWGVTLAWATGGLALAAVALLLTFTLLRFPAGNDMRLAKGLPAVTTPDTWPPANPPATRSGQLDVTRPDHQYVKARGGNRTPHEATEADNTAHQPTAITDTHSAEGDVDAGKVAAALCETGSTAYATGDYQTAYEAYQTAYQTAPTQNALMGSAKALEQLSDKTLQETATTDTTGS